MGFKGKLSKYFFSNEITYFFLVILSKYFFSNEITYFFLVILIEIFILKTTMYHKYTLKYQKFTKKSKKTLLSSMFHFALNIGGISAQSHMLLFVICFSSYLNLVITL
jgi:hypothetical protein